MYAINLTAKNGSHMLTCNARTYHFRDDYLVINLLTGGVLTVSCAYWNFEILEMD